MADGCTEASVTSSRFCINGRGFDALGPADIVYLQTGAERLHYLRRLTKKNPNKLPSFENL